jgi:Flp pilus assembly protein TadD
LRMGRAKLRFQIGDKVGALADAAEAVILGRSDPSAKALLGLVLLETGRAQEATACLSEAQAADPPILIITRDLQRHRRHVATLTRRWLP